MNLPGVGPKVIIDRNIYIYILYILIMTDIKNIDGNISNASSLG